MIRPPGVTLLLVLVLGLAVVTAPPASAHHETQYHWPRVTSQVTITVEMNVSDAWVDALHYAASQWERSSYLEFEFVVGDGGCDESHDVEVCQDAYRKTGWLGRAQKYVSGDHITYGQVDFNLSYGFTKKKRNFVACHELGHVIGVGHRDEQTGNSCMVARWKFLTQKPAIVDAHDVDVVNGMYGHVDVEV